MSTILDAVTSFVNNLGLGLLPLPPKSDTLGGHVPDLSGLARDSQGIICQLQDDKSLDGGDSAHRTGIAAFCNSAADTALLPRFESGSVMVRHPAQAPWNNWRNCTRDQLLGYIPGCWRAGRLDINQRLLQAHAARIPPFTCQNTEKDKPGTTKSPPVGDILLPDDVMYLRICAGDNAAYLDVAGQFALQVAIEIASPDPGEDKTNLLLESIVCGRLNLFVQVHQNYEAFLRNYWSGWRKQPRIAEELIWVVQEELKRYPIRTGIPLLPANLLKLLRSLDLKAELGNLDPKHRLELAGRFVEASLKDAANTLVATMKVSVDVAVHELKKFGAKVDQIAKALADVNQAPNAIRAGLEIVGFTAKEIASAMQVAFPGIPHVDAFAVPHHDVLAVPHADVPSVHQDVAPIHVDARTPHVDHAPHVDFSVFGGHSDNSGPHADVGGIHTDMTTTPHVDVKISHVDAGPAAHIDVAAVGHVDTP